MDGDPAQTAIPSKTSKIHIYRDTTSMLLVSELGGKFSNFEIEVNAHVKDMPSIGKFEINSFHYIGNCYEFYQFQKMIFLVQSSSKFGLLIMH